MSWITARPLIDGNRTLLSTSPEFPKPVFRFEVGRRRDLIPHRISMNGDSVALIRLDDWWDSLWIGFGKFPPLFRHLPAAAVDLATDDPPSFVRNEMLHNPELFGRGDFVVQSLRLCSERQDKRRAVFVEPHAITNQAWVEFETCGLIPLRRSSLPDSGRVKWYRKLAREGRLPPVFLYHHLGVISWLLIDGHDRLLAASLEGIRPTLVGISAVRRAEPTSVDPQRDQIEEVLARQLLENPHPRTVEGINRRLLSMYADEDWRDRTRAVPLRGGIDAWLSESRVLSLPREVFEDPQ